MPTNKSRALPKDIREQSEVQVPVVLNAPARGLARIPQWRALGRPALKKKEKISFTRLVFPRVCQFERHYFTGKSHRVPNLHLKWPRGYARIELAHIKEKPHVKPFKIK